MSHSPGRLLVTVLVMSAFLAVRFLPYLSVSYSLEACATATYRTCAVISLTIHTSWNRCKFSRMSGDGSKRAQRHDGNCCQHNRRTCANNSLFHFSIPYTCRAQLLIGFAYLYRYFEKVTQGISIICKKTAKSNESYLCNG